MVITDKVFIPSDEELTVPEVNLSYPVLHAAAHYLGKYCEHHNNEFMLCRKEEDARACINQGKAVTACTMEFFQKVKKSCRDEFDQYFNCVYKSSSTMSFNPCRNTQAVLDKCLKDNLNIERPPYGYFCEVKVHDSTRPKPEERIIEYPPIDSLPKDAPKPAARFGGRWMFET